MKISKRIENYLPGKHTTIFLVALLLASVSLICLRAYQQRYTVGSDGISYISIAEHYASGDFKTAVNGYWSPMISWLMAPLISIGIESRLTFMIVNSLSAISIILLGSVLIWRYASRNILAVSAYIIGSTMFMAYAVGSLFPDILLTAWTIFFLFLLIYTDTAIDRKPKGRTAYAFYSLLAFVGTIGYLTKMYAAPFFLVVIIMWGLLRTTVNWRKSKDSNRNKLIKGLLPSFLISVFFILLSAPWIIALSLKYDYLTYGSSFSVNTATQFDEPVLSKTKTAGSNNKNVSDKIVQVKEIKIDKPPYDKAVTTTEDRTPKQGNNNYLPGGGANLTIKQKIDNYLARRQQGLPLYYKNLHNLWPLLVVIPLVVGIILLINKLSYRTYNYYYITLLSFIIYFAGYALIAGHRGGNVRYYWPLLLMSLLVGSLAVGDLWKQKHRPWFRRGAIIMWGIIVLSLMNTYPLPSIDRLFAQTKVPVLELAANDFKKRTNLTKYEDFLSNNSRQNRTFAFYVRGQALGSLNTNHSFTDSNLLDNMKKAGVDYFLHFSSQSTLEFKPEQYGGTLVGTYYLGDKYPECINDRDSTYRGKCTLYIIKPNYKTNIQGE